MSKQTITEFLEARIAEDEEELELFYAKDHADDFAYGGTDDYHQFTIGYGRALAECAAKRAIIEQHKDWPVLVDQPTPGSIEPIMDTDLASLSIVVSKRMAWLTEREYVKRFGVEAPTTNMILALAAIYKDHPDYQQDWAL